MKFFCASVTVEEFNDTTSHSGGVAYSISFECKQIFETESVGKMAWGKFTKVYITMILLPATLTTAPCITVLHMSASPWVLTHVRRLTFP
jgi:hypothetical protein